MYGQQQNEITATTSYTLTAEVLVSVSLTSFPEYSWSPAVLFSVLQSRLNSPSSNATATVITSVKSVLLSLNVTNLSALSAKVSSISAYAVVYPPTQLPTLAPTSLSIAQQAGRSSNILSTEAQATIAAVGSVVILMVLVVYFWYWSSHKISKVVNEEGATSDPAQRGNNESSIIIGTPNLAIVPNSDTDNMGLEDALEEGRFIYTVAKLERQPSNEDWPRQITRAASSFLRL